MANFTITITNSVNVFGQSPASLWNAYNWNAFKWGEGTADLITATDHLISESIAPDDAIVAFDTIHFISESLSPQSETTYEALSDGSGYNYVFPSNTIDSEQRARASYTTGSAQGTSWSTLTAGSTSWS